MLNLPVLQGCCTIVLTRGYNCLVDANDWPELRKVSWHFHPKRYAYRNIKESTQKMHRVLLCQVDDKILDDNWQSDHKDADGLNNCRSNLRVASGGQNQWNRRKKMTAASSRFKGVAFKKGKQSKPWYARFSINNKRHHLGYFYSEDDAALAYNAAATSHFGEFARLNEV